MNNNFSKIAIVGLGLIGASFAKSIKKANVFQTISGFDLNSDSVNFALKNKIIDESGTLEEVCINCKVIMIAVPIFAISDVLKLLSKIDLKNAIITDAGSVKSFIVEKAKKYFAHQEYIFVPGHPIAGSEKSGIYASIANLFQNNKVLLTPYDENSRKYTHYICSLWQKIGSIVEVMTIEDHDKILAATSHLPHLTAFVIVDLLSKQADNLDIFRYAAGGFKDFTRIASSDPVMWKDIFLTNKKPILNLIDQLIQKLHDQKELIEQDLNEDILNILTQARDSRNYFTGIIQNKEKNMQNKNLTLKAIPSHQEIQGEILVPGDKSISHRTVILGSLAEGKTEATGFLEGEDTIATANAFSEMGVKIEGPYNGKIVIQGVGLNGLKAPNKPLYLGNSGTSMRLLSGILAAQPFDSSLIGDESLSKRPMSRVVKPLQEMGAEISTNNQGRPPLQIKGCKKLLGIDYAMPLASAQVKSCLLLAGMYATGKTVVLEPSMTRDHTEKMLQGFGYSIENENGKISIKSGGTLKGQNLEIPADFSSATFFIVAATIAKKSNLVLKHVGINPTRTGALEILRLMGADITLLNERDINGEMVADIHVKQSQLVGIEIPENLVSLAIDEFPVLFIAAACAKGKTILTGAMELRVKESDRISSMMEGLQNLGVNAIATEDGAIIEGGEIQGGRVNSYLDHRIAMSFAVASIVSLEPIVILDADNIATSFPNFITLANEVGMKIESFIE